LMKFDIPAFFANLVMRFKFHKNPTRTTSTSHEDVFTFMTKCCWIIFKVRNVSNTSCGENQNTNFILSNFFSPKIVPFVR
jgi:hypothetical protein